MSELSDTAHSPKLADSAPEAKRRHHAPAPSPTKPGDVFAAPQPAQPAQPAKPEPAPKHEVTAADPVAEQHVRGALHSVCRSVDRYTKITQIGKGTYGFVLFFSHTFSMHHNTRTHFLGVNGGTRQTSVQSQLRSF